MHVVNQVDNLRFNRGALINIGYLLSRRKCDYIAMHDVDLLPANPDLSYAFPRLGPFHVSSPHLHPKYHYEKFVGGIMLLQNDHFYKLKGFSNRYFGWGVEDDEFYVRIREAKLQIYRPENIHTGINDTFRHIHDSGRRPRDYKRYFDQKTKSHKRDRFTGVDTVVYELVSTSEIEIDSTPVTVVNIELRCDLNETRWCISTDEFANIQYYLKNKDKLVTHNRYVTLSNGSRKLVESTLAYPQPPMNMRYFIN